MTNPPSMQSASLPSYVPVKYAPLVLQASQGTGLPTSVVAAQVEEESGFNPNATSPVGAEGMFQFMPGTYQAFVNSGLVPANSEYNPGEEVKAYIGYMDQLLAQEHGSVYQALEAYNAGPGNLGAGAGYAATILGNAGTGSGITSGGGTGPGAATGGAGGSAQSTTATLTGLFGSADPFSGVETTLASLAIVVPVVLGAAALIAFGFVKMTGSGGTVKKAAEGAALL